MNQTAIDVTPDLLQAIINTIQAGITLLSPIYEEPVDGHQPKLIDFRYRLVNQFLASYIGLDPEALAGEPLSKLFPAYLTNGVFEAYRKTYETGESQHFDQHYDGDGYNVWANILVTKLGDCLLVTSTDLTEVKQAELRLRQQTEELEAILNGSLNSIIAMTPIRNTQGVITDFWMDSAYGPINEMTGKEPAQVAGTRMIDTFPGHKMGGPFFDLYARVANTGCSEQLIDYYKDDLGLEAWYEASVVKKGTEGIVVTFINVTDRMQTLSHTESILKKLRQSNENLDQFAAIASHDLQEPLRKIKSFSELLLAQYSTTLGEGADLLRRLQSATNRMQTLIRDLLAYSRLSKNEETVRLPLDLNQLIHEVLTDLEVVVNEKRAVFDISPLPTLPGHPLQIQQVFQNLLTNALKFARPGLPPRIKIASRLVKRSELPASLSLSEKPGQPYQEITVADNGIGFNEAYREKIFRAFERLHGRSSRYGGTGIGLAIVQKVMENHNGAVTAHSQEGEGATFTLYFPVE